MVIVNYSGHNSLVPFVEGLLFKEGVWNLIQKKGFTVRFT